MLKLLGIKRIFTFCCILIAISCSRSQENNNTKALIITNVNLIDVINGEVVENLHVEIDSGKIKSITRNIENIRDFSIKIDGRDKFLMPGLAEMHAHIPQSPTSMERTEEVLFLYLSNGITTIRGMLGHPSHLQLRQKANNGEILSPRIFTSSPSLNGNSVTSKEEAIEKVSAYHKKGYDFLKIHPGIQLDVFNQIVETANEVGIDFAGHVPVKVGIRHALKSKYASIDHVDGFLEGLVPEALDLDASANGFFGYNFTPYADISKIDELVQLAKDNEVWIVSTQSLFTRWFAPVSSDELLTQPEMKYMRPATLENWKRRKNESIASSTGFKEAQWKQFDAIRKQLIKKLQDDGHGMLLGSDAPQLFNVPGFSIHHEMDALKEAGLSPLEIIRSGTINPAIYFGMEDIFGSIKEGLDADLVLVDANPLKDIKALQQISGVMIKGNWLSKETISKKLDTIAQNALKN